MSVPDLPSTTASAVLKQTAAAEHPLAQTAALIRRYFLMLLLAVYGLAMFAPGAGLATRDLSLGLTYLYGAVPIPTVLLAVLLFSAGLGANVTELRRVRRFSGVLGSGLLAGWLLGPIAVLLLSRILGGSPTASASLAGFAFVALMPPANSSAAWTQNARGDLAVCLGLMVAATLLSPLAAPLLAPVLARFTGHAAPYEGGWQTMLLMLWITVPIALGMVVHVIVGAERIRHTAPLLSLSNAMILLVLNYCQASLALPQLLDGRVAGLWLQVALSAVGFTGLLFAGGWLVGRTLGLPREQRLALLFGLGMKNTGAALALAGAALAAQPAALLAIIFCTLAQHLLAAFADLLARPANSVQ